MIHSSVWVTESYHIRYLSAETPLFGQIWEEFDEQNFLKNNNIGNCMDFYMCS